MQVMTENKTLPKLRFREFKEHWQENKLGNIATFYNSKRVALTASDREKGEYPYYGASGIIDYVKDFIFEGEYILLGEDGANIVMRNSRLVFLAKGKFWLNNHAHIFQSKDSNAFLCEALERIDYTKYNTGTAQPKLNSDVVKKIKLNLPSSPEQQKIASFLSTVDEKLQQLTKKKELLEEYKKGVMQKIFSQELRFKDEFGNNYPAWEFKRGNELFDSISNKNHNSDLPILAISQEFGAIPRELINYKISVTTSSVSSYKVVEKGDFVISLRSFQGGIEYSNYKGICSPAYIILRPTKEINDYYFKLYFKTHSYIQELTKKLEGIRDGKMISYKYFSEIKLPYPCLKEQQKIANFLSSLDSKIDLVSTQIENTKAFKKGLLQQMFV